jgi:hypothetical protein
MFAFATAEEIDAVDFDQPADSVEIFYWRKHPNLHGWMKRLYVERGGTEVFNCVPVRLDATDIDALEQAVRRDALRLTEGFFFGRSEMHRALKQHAYAVSFYGWPKIDLFAAAWHRAGFRIGGHLVFRKPYTSKNALLAYRHEQAMLLVKGRPPPPLELIEDVIDWRYTGNKLHPTQKPLGILKPLIRAFSRPGETVLDWLSKTRCQTCDEIQGGKKPMDAFVGLINQCLRREEGWKNFYVERMDAMSQHPQPPRMLELFEGEAEAEKLAQTGKGTQAAEAVQKIIDKWAKGDPAEKGWYLQEMARYTWPLNQIEADKLQRAAHTHNPYVLRPCGGVTVAKLNTLVSQKRVERIANWLRKHGSHQEVMIEVEEVLSRLEFGVKAAKFEAALNELAEMLGFAGQQPDRELGEGPDNLWQLKEHEYLLWECKDEVKLDRENIHKDETGQMNNACGWFDTHYAGDKALRIIIIPADKCGQGANFTHDVRVMRPQELKKLRNAVRAFFMAMTGDDLTDLSATRIQELLDAHKLDPEQFTPGYSRRSRSDAARIKRAGSITGVVDAPSGASRAFLGRPASL